MSPVSGDLQVPEEVSILNDPHLGYRIKRYRGTLRLLSWVHLSGSSAEPVMRYAIDRKAQCAYVLKESFLARNLDLGRITPDEMTQKPFDIARLPRDPKAREEAVAYRLDLDLNEAEAKLDKEVRPFVRDAWGRAYIPGSSLKGAFRQALVFDHLMQDETRRDRIRQTCRNLLDKMGRVTRDNIGQIRSWNKRDGHEVARGLEALLRSSQQELGGIGPHSDLLRGLRVGDTAPAQAPLTLCKVGIAAPMPDVPGIQMPPKMPKVFLERMDPGTELSFDLDLDVPLLERLSAGTSIQMRDGYDLLAALENQQSWVLPLEKAFLESRGGSGGPLAGQLREPPRGGGSPAFGMGVRLDGPFPLPPFWGTTKVRCPRPPRAERWAWMRRASPDPSWGTSP